MAMMAHTSNKGYDGMELLDLLFDQTDGILRQDDVCHREWPVTQHSMLRPADGGNDFLDTLLSGSDSVSVSGSPLWSPSPSDSGISEDPNSDQIDSPMPPDSPPFETCYLQAPQLPQSALDTAEPDVSIDLDGWESRYFPERTGEIQCASDIHRTQLSLGFPLTVKDLLLSGTSEPPPQPSQQSFQELILSEDEKKLLAKEGVSLPTQLPLTKYEERILKKIRRKIRNKQSAQESRKKKKEYIDGLEGRMAACSAHNQELQRKVLQLEKNNTSLMEQLRRLQALVMNGTNKAAQTGTCVLVLLLSFSLILFPSLQPFSSSKVTEVTDFSAVRVQSRSLHSVVEVQQTLPAFSLDKGVEAVTSLLARLKMKQEFAEIDAVPHNHSLAEQNHQSGDPITGHVTAVTWTAHRDAPHADDM